MDRSGSWPRSLVQAQLAPAGRPLRLEERCRQVQNGTSDIAEE